MILIDHPEHSLDAARVPNLTNMPRQYHAEYWTFMLGGLVDIPLCLSLADLKTYPSTTHECLLACSSHPPENDQVRQGRWEGTTITNLLAEVNLQPSAHYAHLYAADGYTTCVELADLENALLAYQLDDQPLTTAQGFPVRLIIPHLYGYKMPKHIQHVILSDQALPGYWEQRGWPLKGEIIPTARFAYPHHQAILTGPTTLSGIAYTGEQSLSQVEISVDDGPWMPISLNLSPANKLTHWSIDWQPPAPGSYRLQVRPVINAGSKTGTNHAPHSIIVQVQS